MARDRDRIVSDLREGWISLGEARLKIGSSIRDAADALGLNPERPAHRWREVGGADGLRWTVGCDFLWFPRSTQGVELVFHNDALSQVAGADGSWKSSETSWADYRQEIEIQNYRQSRRELEALLGAPGSSTERSDDLLVASWPFKGMELTLCWETRTPSLSIRIAKPHGIQQTGPG